MNVPDLSSPLHPTDDRMLQMPVERVTGQTSRQVMDILAIEEPLEIQLTYGPRDSRQLRSISVTMRTPGNDFDLAAGFLMTEGVVLDANDIEQITYAGESFMIASYPLKGWMCSSSVPNRISFEWILQSMSR